MDQERELLLTNSKEWLVDELIRQRLAHHSKMMAKIKFHNHLLDRLAQVLNEVKSFHEYGTLPYEIQD